MVPNEESRSKEKLVEDVLTLTNWLNKQPQLPKDIDNEILTAFVYGTKSIEIAIKKLETFISYRVKVPQLFGFSVRDPLTEKYKEVAESIKMFVLPKPTAEGYVVLYSISNDLSKYDFSISLVRFSMICELILKFNPEMEGLVIFCDMKDLTKTILRKMNPMRAINIVKWLQTAIPVKLKNIVLYNADVFTDAFVNILKPFVAKKLFERVRVTKKDVSVVKNYIEEEKLPSDLGGKELSTDELHDQWMAIINKHRDWFKRTSEWKPDDTKRQPEQNTCGFEGTLRSLELD